MQPSADLSLAQRIDSVCDRFEADWKAGRRQPLEAYLADVKLGEHEAMRSALQAVQEELEKQVHAIAGTSVSQSRVRTGTYQPGRVDLVGGSIGRFKILSLLGEGAFGKVYKARDPQLEREVAVKVPKLEAFGGPFDLSRFLREAKAAAAIQHPNICPVHEVVVEGERPFIVMALIPGKSLADYLKDRPNPLPQKQLALLVRKLALALQAAHEKGIVHRDLKPANILFDPKRKDVVITDFGLASRATSDARHTQSGVLLGTPAYMSPEQARGEAKHIGPASDIFSLGVILYEMLTGKRAFHGSLGEVIGQVQHVDPVPPRLVNADIDPRLDAICRKALAKTPEQRFASMKAMAAALDKYLKDQPVPAAPTAAQKPAEAEQSVGLAQVVAALSADRRAETEAVVEAAVRKTRIPLWKRLAPAGLLGILLVLGIIFFARTPTATVLINIDVDLNDKTLAFFLDSKAIPADELKSPIELKVGTHELLVKRGDEVIRRFTFTVSRDAGPRIEMKEETLVTPVAPTPESPPKKRVGSEPPPDSADGFLPLFNGTDLTGWEVDGDPKGWTVIDGAIATVPDIRHRGWLFSKQSFGDFELRLEFALSFQADTGIAVRGTPGEGGGNKHQLQVQIKDDAKHETQYITGSIILTGIDSFEPPNRAMLKLLGEWNEMRITARGSILKIEVNGQVLHKVDLAKIDPDSLRGDLEWGPKNLKRQRGRIGLQYAHKEVKFRKLRAREFDPSRLFAEWLLQNNAMVNWIDRLDKLPSGPVVINSIEGSRCPALTDEVLAKNAAVLGQVKMIHGNDMKLTGTGFAALKDSSLEVIDMPTGSVTDAGLEAICQVRSLKKLELLSNRVGDVGVAHLHKLPRLSVLDLGDNKLTEKGIPHLAKCPKLGYLNLSANPIGNEGLAHLSGLKLRSLGLGATKITDTGLVHVKGMTDLDDIALWNTEISDAGLAHLAALTNLQRLYLWHTKIAGPGLKHIAGLRKLAVLHLADTPVDDNAVPLLLARKGLRELNLTGTKVSDTGLKQLREGLPYCKITPESK